MSQAPAPQPSAPDWFAGIVAQVSSGMAGGGSGGGSGVTLDDILQQSMWGMSGRQGLTSQPLTGLLPKWVYRSPQVLQAVTSGYADPYLVKPNDPSTWRVYTGPGAVDYHGKPRNKFSSDMAPGSEMVHEPGHDKTQMVNSVANQPFLWSEDQVAQAIKKFQDAGVTNVTDFDSMQKAWSGLVQRAGAMYSLSSGQRKVTPWDVLDLYKSEMQKAGTFGQNGSGSGNGPSTVTQRSRSISTITNGDGWSVLQNTLSRMLGRDPSEEEVRDFVGRMNHLAAKHPTITTSTTSGIGTAAQSTTSHTQAGFNSSDILQNAYQDAQANPDYAETQAATTYFNALLSGLGQIGG